MMGKKSGELPKLIIIAGPTASGKTGVSVELARLFDAEIINADSMQVYRGMDIGTAKPSLEERKGIPHHLLDVVDPDEKYNAAIYRDMASAAALDIIRRGKRPIVVGGTGLYIKSLLGGLFQCPPSAPEIRESLEREWETGGPRILYERLEQLDPQRARKIHPNDRMRVIRALEVISLTNRLPSALRRQHGFSDRSFSALKLCLKREREELYHRINTRAIAMIDGGLLIETEDLLGRGYSPRLKPLQAIGYKQAVEYLEEGHLSLEKTIEKIQRETRRYAKRQCTWFRADSDYTWVDPGQMGILVRKIETFLDVSHGTTQRRSDRRQRSR
jgi:tRNA dimethylallyltransferase